MFLLIDSKGGLSLEDSDNCREFSVVEEVDGTAAAALAAIAEPAEADHFWLDAEAVIELSGRKQDQVWVEGFWDMLEKVQAYGYSDMAAKRVKAHLVKP